MRNLLKGNFSFHYTKKSNSDEVTNVFLYRDSTKRPHLKITFGVNENANRRRAELLVTTEGAESNKSNATDEYLKVIRSHLQFSGRNREVDVTSTEKYVNSSANSSQLVNVPFSYAFKREQAKDKIVHVCIIFRRE